MFRPRFRNTGSWQRGDADWQLRLQAQFLFRDEESPPGEIQTYVTYLLNRFSAPAHHEIEETIDEYLARVSIEDKQPLFQSVNKAGTALTGRALNRYDAWAAIRKRARNAGFLTPVGCHTWRATGVTVYLENGGRLEHAQQMAAHESPRTTKLYDRTKDEITIGEVERIQL